MQPLLDGANMEAIFDAFMERWEWFHTDLHFAAYALDTEYLPIGQVPVEVKCGMQDLMYRLMAPDKVQKALVQVLRFF